MIVQHPSKKQIAQAFGLKASRYNDNAGIQTALLSQLVPRVTNVITGDGVWVDLGCGTGILERYLGPVASRFVCMDLAREPLVHLANSVNARVKPVQADLEHMPFADNLFEGVVVASVLQWVPDLGANLQRIQRVLRPDGYLVFSVFVKGSFQELCRARQTRGLPVPTSYPESGAFRAEFQRAGFRVVESEEYWHTIYFPDARELLRSLSNIGGTAVAGPRMNRRELQEFIETYEECHTKASGVPITYRALLGTCVARAAG